MIIYDPAYPSTKYTLLGLMKLPYTVSASYPSEGRTQVSAIADRNTQEESGAVTTSTYGVKMQGRMEEEVDTIVKPRLRPTEHHRHQESKASMMTRIQRNEAISLPAGSNCVTIRIAMPSDFGWRSWRCYEAMIETMAVGIYLYATFILTSLVFLSSDQAMQYATVMAICLSVVRILIALL